jgi:hypothetical protein
MISDGFIFIVNTEFTNAYSAQATSRHSQSTSLRDISQPQMDFGVYGEKRATFPCPA